jgi:hypothetical protein
MSANGHGNAVVQLQSLNRGAATCCQAYNVDAFFFPSKVIVPNMETGVEQIYNLPTMWIQAIELSAFVSVAEST